MAEATDAALVAPMATSEPTLDTGDIQADVLLGINMKRHLLIVYLDISDGACRDPDELCARRSRSGRPL